jgi:alpha-amylase/alpha-mannosidase (GH57 family)
MKGEPLSLVFLWHMHQPYYKDPLTGSYRLPWVRLHGTKDYLDMVEILREFPGIRQNFNLVPSLLDQINDYTANGATDVFLEMSRKNSSELNEDDKIFILGNFFLANWENMIKPFPRYYELLVKRGTHTRRSDLGRAARHFTSSDFLDLQLLFNFCWIDPLFRERDPDLARLGEKGRNFSEEEKEFVIAKHIEILGRIIPAYREMALSGRVELSFSPFYHPILPLLCDTDIAKVAMPDAALPVRRFTHPEDAERQIHMGLEYFKGAFGFLPSGMWPSEGSVSEEVLRIASKMGLKWVATDEGVLSNSLNERFRDDSGHRREQHLLYRPYTFEDVSIIFRDHQLSDLIGFVYSQWDPANAARDFIGRLVKIKESLPADRPALVPVILDGENAWEYFRSDGRDFLMYLYEGILKEERLRTTTISEYIESNGRGRKLDYLFPGSWINSNFRIWIGHEEDNLAWDYLAETRQRLEEHCRDNSGEAADDAWKAIYVAEGSDWNWWYGDEHSTESQEDFDELFRRNLMKVYMEMGKDVPGRLFVPILKEDRGFAPTLAMRGFVEPKIDGIVTSYYEWYQGAQLDVKKSGGSMHKSESLISTVYFGFNRDFLFIRLDPRTSFADFEDADGISVMFTMPSNMKIECSMNAAGSKGVLYEEREGGWVKVKDITEVAVQDIFEAGIAFSDLKAEEKQEIQFFVSVRRGSEELERCPWRGHISVTVPTDNFEAMMWY